MSRKTSKVRRCNLCGESIYHLHSARSYYFCSATCRQIALFQLGKTEADPKSSEVSLSPVSKFPGEVLSSGPGKGRE